MKISLIVQNEQEQQKMYYTFVNARACQNSGATDGVITSCIGRLMSSSLVQGDKVTAHN